jgi:hypothetical protein
LRFRRNTLGAGGQLNDRQTGFLENEYRNVRCNHQRIPWRMQDLTDVAMAARPFRRMSVEKEERTNRHVKDQQKRGDSSDSHAAAYILLRQGCQARL